MRISRVSEELIAPSWAFEGKKNCISADLITTDQIEKIQDMPIKTLTEGQLVAERNEIEKCSSNNSTYSYNSRLDKDVTAHLKEYAMACGMSMDKFKSVDPKHIESIKEVQANVNDARQTRIAATTVVSEDVAKLQSDPFKIDSLGNNDYMDESDWQGIHKAISLGERPSMASGAIRPMRGGENYNSNSYSQIGKGQNSITDPNAIGAYAESGIEETGVRLKRENQEKIAQQKQNSIDWEQGKIDAMEYIDIIPKGTVFPTEVMSAQPGLNNAASRIANINASDIPDQTLGEMIADGNEVRKQSIQRSEDVSEEWQSVNSALVRGVSDTFASSLKAALNKNT